MKKKTKKKQKKKQANKFGGSRYCGKTVIRFFISHVITLSIGHLVGWIFQP